MANAEGDVLATGVIEGPEARGSVKITRSGSGEVAAHISDAWIAPGAPDVRIYLASDPAGDVETGMTVELGKVTELTGELVFAIPTDADLSALNALVVHCFVYSVTFGVARLAHQAA